MAAQLARYEVLAPEPLPPGPLVRSPAAPLLRLLLRAFNVALAALSLLLIGAALWMEEQYKRGGGPPGPAPPAGAPWDGAGSEGYLATAAVHYAKGHASGVAAYPWFIYAVGGTGAYCFATALTGLAGVKRDRRGHLAAYILLLAVLLLGEAGATLLLLTDNAWRGRIPDDPSGRWRQIQALVEHNCRAARLAAVAMLCAELAALAAASWLHAIYTAAYEAWLDDREERTERAREMLTRAAAHAYTGGGSNTWTSRLRSKYGVDPCSLEAATNAARQTAALQADGM